MKILIKHKTVSKKLATDVVNLVRSIGGYAKIFFGTLQKRIHTRGDIHCIRSHWKKLPRNLN